MSVGGLGWDEVENSFEGAKLRKEADVEGGMLLKIISLIHWDPSFLLH